MTYQTTAMLIAERDALILETRERALKAEAERDALRQDAERFAQMLFARGAMDQAPCFFCGYNGAGYFTPEMHPCAARHHAALESEK